MVVHFRKHYKKLVGEEVLFKSDVDLIPDHIAKRGKRVIPQEKRATKTGPEPTVCNESTLKSTSEKFVSNYKYEGPAYWMAESPKFGVQLPSVSEDEQIQSQFESSKSSFELDFIQHFLNENVYSNEQQFVPNCGILDSYHDMSIYSPSSYSNSITVQSPAYSSYSPVRYQTPICIQSPSYSSFISSDPNSLVSNLFCPSNYVFDGEFMKRNDEPVNMTYFG